MSPSCSDPITKLIQKGVVVHGPETVSIAPEVDIETISGNGVVLHSGCRISGANTAIAKGAVIGEEGPVTLENCQLGSGVRLKGGFFRESVFLKNAGMGSGAHVREGTILEEEASGAHTVGFKQTILFPYVTVGSLINFCDCLMAGGTDRKNHSEVGSSYIHFNFTPNQDKATASLMGDVPRGVLLKQPPIFLGGQGGLVGPSRLAYGTVIAAGSIFRKDELRPNRLISSGEGRSINAPNVPGFYRTIKRIIQNNIIYIANLIALEQWYRHVRPQFVSGDLPEPVLAGLKEKVAMAISERLKRLGAFAEALPASAEKYRSLFSDKASPKLIGQKMEFHEKWGEIYTRINTFRSGEKIDENRDAFLESVLKAIGEGGEDYLRVITSLTDDDRGAGTRWLQSIVYRVCSESFDALPGFSFNLDTVSAVAGNDN